MTAYMPAGFSISRASALPNGYTIVPTIIIMGTIAATVLRGNPEKEDIIG